MVTWMLSRLAGWRGYAAAFLAGGLVLGAVGWAANGWRMGAQLADERTSHATVMEEHARAALVAVQAARDEERRRVAAIEEIRNAADQEIADVQRRERAAADVRVRDAVVDYARRHRPAGNPGAAEPSQTTGDPIGMFAELLGELDDLAGQYAAAADRARAAGLTCERAYDAVRAQ